MKNKLNIMNFVGAFLFLCIAVLSVIGGYVFANKPQNYTPGIDPDYKTGNLYDKECLEIQPGHVVNIYIDDKDSKKYYIDFENFS